MGNSAQEITAELAKLVEVREDVIVFAIVHSRSGLEMVSNTGDLVMKLGMLDVAKMTVMDIHAQMSMEHGDGGGGSEGGTGGYGGYGEQSGAGKLRRGDGDRRTRTGGCAGAFGVLATGVAARPHRL